MACSLSLFHYGVGRHRSTELAVTHSSDAMRKQAQTEILTDCVLIHLSKDFDTISHAGVLKKTSIL